MRTNIPGWAYTATQDEEAKRRSDRYKEIQHWGKDAIQSVSPQYGRTHYKGVIPPGSNLSAEDIAILCDSGNTCFGASVDMDGGHFSCTIWTD